MLYTLSAFAAVQLGIWRMIDTAREACSDAEQRRRLTFLRDVTPHVWNMFWLMWFCQYFGVLSVFQAELGNMFANFLAKVTPSSRTAEIHAEFERVRSICCITVVDWQPLWRDWQPSMSDNGRDSC